MKLGLKLTLRHLIPLAGMFTGISKVLAQIIYNMDSYTTDAITKVRSLENVGSNSPLDNAVVYASQGLEFTGIQYIDVGLEYTLGNELALNGAFDADTDWTKQENWSISGGEAHKVNGAECSVYQEPPLTEGKVYVSVFKLTTFTSGSFNIWIGTGVPGNVGVPRTSIGTYSEVFKLINSSNFGVIGSSDAEGSVDDLSIKEVLYTTQSLWIFDYSTNIWDIVTDFDDIKYKIELRTIGHYFKLNASYTQEDVDKANLKPEAVLNYHKFGDTSVDFSFLATDVVDYMQPAIENGSVIHNLSGGEVGETINFDQTQFTNADLLDTGVPLTMYKQDVLGRIIEKAPEGYICFNEDERQADTQWTVEGDYTIMQMVKGYLYDLDELGVSLGTTSYRIEIRTLSSDGNYKINNMARNYTPTLPSGVVTITKTPIIGYADNIEYSGFTVINTDSLLSDGDQLKLFEEYLVKYGFAFTLKDGTIWRDENNEIYYTFR